MTRSFWRPRLPFFVGSMLVAVCGSVGLGYVVHVNELDVPSWLMTLMCIGWGLLSGVVGGELFIRWKKRQDEGTGQPSRWV